jgi:predicted ArsR family transcriptional regulator
MPRSIPYRSRRALLDLLKQEGAQDATRLGQRLGISAMAVRQHLYELRADGLAEYRADRPSCGISPPPPIDSFPTAMPS